MAASFYYNKAFTVREKSLSRANGNIMIESAQKFWEWVEGYPTILHAYHAEGVLEVVIAVEDLQRDAAGAQAFIDRCDVSGDMDITIACLPDAQYGDIVGGRMVIRFLEALV